MRESGDARPSGYEEGWTPIGFSMASNETLPGRTCLLPALGGLGLRSAPAGAGAGSNPTPEDPGTRGAAAGAGASAIGRNPGPLRGRRSRDPVFVRLLLFAAVLFLRVLILRVLGV